MIVRLTIWWPMKTDTTEHENAAEARRSLIEAAKLAKARWEGDGNDGEIVTGYRKNKHTLALYEIKQVS